MQRHYIIYHLDPLLCGITSDSLYSSTYESVSPISNLCILTTSGLEFDTQGLLSFSS